MSDPPRKPLPRISAVTAPFWGAAAEQRLRMPRCKACAAFVWPPRPSCGECGGEHFEWTDLSGRGRVYSFTVIRQVVDRSRRGTSVHKQYRRLPDRGGEHRHDGRGHVRPGIAGHLATEVQAVPVAVTASMTSASEWFC